MAASVGVSSEWSLAGTAPFRADLVIGTRHAAARAAPPSRVSCDAYAARICVELRCAELHPVRCDVRLRGADLESLVIIACENGALAHGITPAWYDSRRLPSMAEIVTQRCGLNES
ncbi:MAG TPA: hypothetical protein VMK12_24965 [Anaeromyxobacteraceae bacterium]|nr:hypothetical protein [Anaeromyxobacteraceae bacterium]